MRRLRKIGDPGLQITIHRGTHEIGGCVTEYKYKGWRLFVDYGERLPGYSSEEEYEFDGLNYGDVSKSALLITHYHEDHIGRIAELPADLPIFMGHTAKEIQTVLSEHMQGVDEKQKALLERLRTVQTFNPGEEFSLGEFKIMPIVMDHSAFDAYAFKIEVERTKVFHTGDFRTHGFRSGKLPQVLNKYVGTVDYVVCEATNILRSEKTAMPEYELQRKFEDAFRSNKYNVVYVSSTNVDRLFGLYHAALRTGRPFYVDAFQYRIMKTVAGRDTIWGKSRLYRFDDEFKPITLQYEGNGFRVTDKFKDFLSEKGYVLVARTNEKFYDLMSKIPSDGRKMYLSKWKGYVDKTNAAYDEKLANSIGEHFEYMHTSGHCDMESLENLFSMLQPKTIIPMHTDDPDLFANIFCDKWPVIVLNDQETFVVDGWIYGNVLTMESEGKEEYKVVENLENLPWWVLGKNRFGEFPSFVYAEDAFRQVKYAPGRLFGYEAYEYDFEDPVRETFAKDNTFIAKEYETFATDMEKFMNVKDESDSFRVLCVVDEMEFNHQVIIPCEVVPQPPKRPSKIKVKVRPLVRLSNEKYTMKKTLNVWRADIFPYAEDIASE